ncbi:hypothetical protein M0R04_01700 [Candidatus Dojkabacteria bacterium]|jgi:2'-5' RNA ligase|nr:hypothetical protein [Candidatus Dojkabacteria bacterium]
MNNTFLAIFPNEENNHKIRKVIGEVGRVFEGEQISVRWGKPENIHIEVFDFGNINFLKKQLILFKLKKEKFLTFNISLSQCKLGSSRKYKDLVYLTLDKGADELRDIVFGLRNRFSTKDISQFIPHISIGRVSKDLTSQEYTNLLTDIRNINKQLNIKNIKFETNEVFLVERSDDDLKILKSFK